MDEWTIVKMLLAYRDEPEPLEDLVCVHVPREFLEYLEWAEQQVVSALCAEVERINR